jgi:hypothetical protein
MLQRRFYSKLEASNLYEIKHRISGLKLNPSAQHAGTFPKTPEGQKQSQQMIRISCP